MKNRNLLTNLLYIVILLALVGFVVCNLVLTGMGEATLNAISAVLLAVAILAVALCEIVFPLIDNKDMLKDGKYKLLAVLKTVLFAGAVAVLFLYMPCGILTNVKVALIAFVVLYFIQFFISLDPKAAKKDDEDEDDDEDEADDDEDEAEADEDEETDAPMDDVTDIDETGDIDGIK